MSIDERSYDDCVSPRDTSFGTFEPLMTNPDKRSWTLNKKLSYMEQQSIYGKLASFQFPKESLPTKESNGTPSLYSSVSSSPSFADPDTPGGSASSYNPLKFAPEPTGPTPPRRGACFTHRRSTPLSHSSNESIFTTHTAQSPTTTTYDSFSSYGPTVTTHTHDVEPKIRFVSDSPTLAQPQLVTQRSEPFIKSRNVVFCEGRLRRHSAQGKHSALPLPMIDLDVVSQPLVPRAIDVSTKGKSGACLERFSVSSESTVDELGIIEDTDEEVDPEDCIDELQDVSIVDFLRESISPRAMRVLVRHDPVSVGDLVDVSRVLGQH